MASLCARYPTKHLYTLYMETSPVGIRLCNLIPQWRSTSYLTSLCLLSSLSRGNNKYLSNQVIVNTKSVYIKHRKCWPLWSTYSLNSHFIPLSCKEVNLSQVTRLLSGRIRIHMQARLTPRPAFLVTSPTVIGWVYYLTSNKMCVFNLLMFKNVQTLRNLSKLHSFFYKTQNNSFFEGKIIVLLRVLPKKALLCCISFI